MTWLAQAAIGQYAPGNSFVHRLDPRAKLVGALFVLSGLFAVESLAGLLGFALFLTGATGLAGFRLGFVSRSLRPVWPLLAFTTVVNAIGPPGEAWFRWGPLVVTQEGLARGAFLSGRLVLLVFAMALITLTTSPLRLTDGVEWLLRPLRRLGVPSHELALMMTIALRFIPTLLEEAEKIMKAQAARGADFERGNPYQRARSFIPVLVPLFVGAFRRADELALAMEARGYRGATGRTKMHPLVFRRADLLAVGLTGLWCLGAAWWL